MTHTLKKVALFAAVVSVAAVSADKGAVLATLDKVVALDNVYGIAGNVVVAAANGYVNAPAGVTGVAFGKRVEAQFVPVWSTKVKEKGVKFTVGADAPKGHHYSADELLEEGLEIKDGKVAGKAKTVTYKAAEADATFEVSPAVKEDKAKSIDAKEAVVIKVGDDVSKLKLDANALKKAGFKLDDDKLAVADKDVTEDVVPAAADKAEVAMKEHEYSVSNKAKASLNVLATVYLAASIANTVRHLMAKKADQVDEEGNEEAPEAEEVA